MALQLSELRTSYQTQPETAAFPFCKGEVSQIKVWFLICVSPSRNTEAKVMKNVFAPLIEIQGRFKRFPGQKRKD